VWQTETTRLRTTVVVETVAIVVAMMMMMMMLPNSMMKDPNRRALQSPRLPEIVFYS
jgi:hypothetical protein